MHEQIKEHNRDIRTQTSAALNTPIRPKIQVEIIRFGIACEQALHLRESRKVTTNSGNITQPKCDVLLYLLVSTRAVIGQLENTRSVTYSTDLELG